jgi:hypothetical protein
MRPFVLLLLAATGVPAAKRLVIVKVDGLPGRSGGTEYRPAAVD